MRKLSGKWTQTVKQLNTSAHRLVIYNMDERYENEEHVDNSSTSEHQCITSESKRNKQKGICDNHDYETDNVSALGDELQPTGIRWRKPDSSNHPAHYDALFAWFHDHKDQMLIHKIMTRNGQPEGPSKPSDSSSWGDSDTKNGAQWQEKKKRINVYWLLWSIHQ